MRVDLPLWILLLATAATYPAIGLSWCAVALLGDGPWSRSLTGAGWPILVTAVLLVSISAVSCLRAGSILVASVIHTRRLWTRLARRRTTVPRWLAAEARRLGLDEIVLIRGDEQAAMTVGWWRPRVVVTTGLIAALPRTERRVVLVHERTHQRRRDPLRVMAVRVLAAHLWFLPIAVDLCRRAREDYELDADAPAIERYGSAAVAGALLRMVETASPRAAAPVMTHFAASSTLTARVRRLEGDVCRPPWTVSRRVAASVVAATGFAVAVAGAWVLMSLACPCGM